MKFQYFKKPNGKVVRRMENIAKRKADLYKEAGYKKCDPNGNVDKNKKVGKSNKQEDNAE